MSRKKREPKIDKSFRVIPEYREQIDYVIVHNVDRLARNRGDDAEIMKVLRECGVQLVSTSESIDETPSGMLLHGIMSSIAEFYSQNLATEVKKGMGEKIKSGGTVGRAPLGYLNIRTVDEKGREERTVIIDEERAPLIKMAFEKYASGEWTIKSLTEYLAACGLNTRSTARMPSKPIPFQTLGKILSNPYYKGIVTYKGVEYAGAHEPLVDNTTWEKTQTVLESRINGERNNKHPHFLKGTVYCAFCGKRMLISNMKKKNGTVYPYFVCSGRRRGVGGCKSRYVLIGEVERKMEQLYEDKQLPPQIRAAIEEELQGVITKEKQKYDLEIDGLLGQKRTLEHKSEKLLEAHYNDAIPMDLLKAEQEKITKELAAINHEIKQHDITFDQLSENLTNALALLDDVATFYRNGSDIVKRMLNQAIFEKIYVSCSKEVPLEIEAEYRPPFNTIIEPFKDELAKVNRAIRSNSKAALAKIVTAKNRILKNLRCGLAACSDTRNIESYSNSNFFTYKSSSKELLVEMKGVEPLSKNTSGEVSTSVVYFH